MPQHGGDGATIKCPLETRQERSPPAWDEARTWHRSEVVVKAQAGGLACDGGVMAGPYPVTSPGVA